LALSSCRMSAAGPELVLLSCKMSPAEPENTGGDQRPPGGQVVDLVKSIVASASLTGLLVASGYLIEVSFRRFLGVDLPDSSTTDYAFEAGQFLLSSANLLLSWISDDAWWVVPTVIAVIFLPVGITYLNAAAQARMSTARTFGTRWMLVVKPGRSRSNADVQSNAKSPGFRAPQAKTGGWVNISSRAFDGKEYVEVSKKAGCFRLVPGPTTTLVTPCGENRDALLASGLQQTESDGSGSQ